MRTRLTLSLLALAPVVHAEVGASSPSAAPADVPAVSLPSAESKSSAPRAVEATPVPERVQSSARGLRQLQFNGENDKFALPGNDDKYYTNGGTIAYVTPALNSLQSVWDYREHYGIGQELFTAKDRLAAIPPRDDRPYAAWLYGMFGASWDDGESLDVVTLRAGVVGPSALGKQVQDNYHNFIGVEKLKGWGTQLRDEPGINVEWRRNWRIAVIGQAMDGGFGVDIIPMLYAEFGTVRDSVAAGAQIRLGKNLPADYGVSDLRKGGVDGAPVAFKSESLFVPDAYYVYAGAMGEYRVWDMTLKGNMYHDSNSVTMYHSVRQYGYGAAIHWGATRLTLSQVLRSKEFLHQEGVFWYGSISLSHAF